MLSPVSSIRAVVVTLAAACVFSIVVVLPFLPWESGSEQAAFFEVDLTTEAPGYAQLYFDTGAGYSEASSARLRVTGSSVPETYRFGLSAGTLLHLRFDPSDSHARVTIQGARIVRPNGDTIRTFSPHDFSAAQQIASLEVRGSDLQVTTASDANDPMLNIVLHEPVSLGEPSHPLSSLPLYALRAFVPLSVILLTVFFAGRSGEQRFGKLRRRTFDWLGVHPRTAVFLAATLAVILSSYPVVFLGKSYVSPNFSDGTFLLYESFPTLPGHADTSTESAKGSDVGAIIWQQVPYSSIQSRALFSGELPLWNRYNSSGTVLLGQGQSMFGDPLHFLVLLAGGDAWAWDLKYLLAKTLFCAGLGLIVWQCTRHSPASFLTVLSSAFVGFFIYRVNHPAFFSVCYGPWILLAWVCLAEARSLRPAARACLLLLIANVAEIHSGTVKEAYMLLISLNFTGICVLIGSRQPWIAQLRLLGAAAWTGLLFILLTSISWTSFLEALKQSHTSYNNPLAFQILPIAALGFFDEVFYRPLVRDELVFNPSVNFLVLGGLLYVIAAWRSAARHKHAKAIAWSALPPAALAFGIVPPQWIVRIPFLGNVHHVDNSFSCVLIILTTVLAGFGWRVAFERLRTSQGARDLKICGALLLLLLGAWLALTQTVHRPIYGNDTVVSLLKWGEKLPVSGFVWASFAALPLALTLFLLLLRRLFLTRILDLPGLLFLSLAVLTMIWRFGVHSSRVGPPSYVFTPSSRADFHASSPAVAAIQHDRSEPGRVIGLGGNMFPGWSGVYDLENAAGADAIANPHYRELVNAIGLETIWGWRVYVVPQNAAAQKGALDFLNVRYYVDLPSSANLSPAKLTRLISADLDVYKSQTAWPRAFFAQNVIPYDAPGDLAGPIRASSGQPFAAMLRDEIAASDTLRELVGPSASTPIVAARDYKLTTNTTEFTIDAPGPGLAVLHEAWLPRSFRAVLNGNRVPLLRINHAFKGVQIPAAGTHTIAVRFQPRGFVRAEYMTGAGVFLILATGVVLARMNSAETQLASS